jgi:ribonuclease-3
MAVFGDARIDAVLCRWWWDRPGPHTKADWDQVCINQTSNAALSARARRFGIDHCVVPNSSSFHVSDKMTATAMEAMLGAVYLDGGEAELERMMRVLGSH